MTPDRRRWTEAMIAKWSARVAELEDHPEPSSSTVMRSTFLADVVADLRRRLAIAGPAPTATAVALDALQAHLAAAMPRTGVGGVLLNAGAIMAATRRQLQARLGLAVEDAPEDRRPRWHSAPERPPEHDPEPFVAGPQLELI